MKKNIQNLTSEEYWKNVLEELRKNGKMILYSNLINTKAKQKDDLTLEIIFPNGLTAFGKSMLEKPETINDLTKLVSMQIGKEMRIKLIDAKEYVPKEEKIEEAIKKLDIPLEIIED